MNEYCQIGEWWSGAPAALEEEERAVPEPVPYAAEKPGPTVLHGYHRSAASWRVRIALGLKSVAVRQVPHHLRRGEQRVPGYLALNPQGLVPALEFDDGSVLTQSVAIVEWLDEAYPEPKLLPADPIRRARVRAFALVLAADTHPLQNLGVLARLRGMSRPEEEVQAWAADANAAGLAACEALLAGVPGPFCFWDAPTLADICLVPQLGNARRFGVDVARYPRLLAAEAACMALPSFADAVPDRQPDAE
jgi:maleylpyruvate isomerase